MPPRLRQIAIEGFRSIDDQIVIDFPENQPLVLIGENNSGKSNIIRAIELMFGEFHPKFKKLDDYDHHARNPKNPVCIDAVVAGLSGKLSNYGQPFGCSGFRYKAEKGAVILCLY